MHLGLELCPGQDQGGTRLCNTFTPAGALFDRVRLWLDASAQESGSIVPVALRWPVSFYFGAPFAGVHRQVSQMEMARLQLIIFRSFVAHNAAPGARRFCVRARAHTLS
jgi:hypothetical protein